MNFYSVRLIFFISIVVLYICHVCIRKFMKKVKMNEEIIAMIVLITIMIIITNSIQLEGLFLKFKNVEKSIEYSFPNSKIIKTIDSSNCIFVLYEATDGTRNYTHFIKDGDKVKFKSPNDNTTKTILYKEYIITIERTKKRDTCIGVRTTSFSDKQLNVKDSKNSDFYNIDDIEQDVHIYERYTILDELPNDYWIEINGEKYQINNYII